MGMATVTATVWECDGCGKQYIIPDGDNLPPGFYGTVDEVGALGNSGTVEWYACKSKCVTKAIAEALRREYEGG